MKYLKKNRTSVNIIFKQRLLWSLGLLDGFRRSISADTSDFVGRHEYRNVIRKDEVFDI